MQLVHVLIQKVDIHLQSPVDVSAVSGQLASAISDGVAAANSDATGVASPAQKTGLEVVGDVVIDHRTGLMWTRDNLPGGSGTLDKLEKAAAECRAGGFSDWQIPERSEALTLIDDTKHGPCLDKDVFPNCKSDYYWTRTSCAWNASAVWVVGFNGGHVNGYHRDYLNAFGRAVRRVSASQ